MGVRHSFFAPDEQALAEEFLAQGYVIRPVDDREALDELRAMVAGLACEFLGLSFPNDVGDFLNHIERAVPIERLNELRLATYRKMNAVPWFRPTYFALARSGLEKLVGNELAMQNRVNLSIQLPQDDSSLLPIHADAFGGETPFQVVEWLPLVDCHGTKSMFILPRPANERALAAFTRYQGRGMDTLFDDVKDELVWLDVPYGSVLIFSPNQLHGGAVNTEPETRWSMNCRITGLFTPYRGAEKKLGSYYLPITTRPVTEIGIAYKEPSGFSE
ncbi:MAG: sporadic carbohydrate cluster 2OG-Fe(II) oxygenase [Candidatus Binatia bacterium]